MIRVKPIGKILNVSAPRTVLFLTGLIFLGYLFSQNCLAQAPGVNADELLIGQSCALKGPTRLLGQGMQEGALTYFNHINENGGIGGRKIRLISYDDGYEPDACAKNTIKLIEQDNVFLLFGYVGTPTSKVAAPIANENKVPYFGPFTGAEFLRNPVDPYVFNIRASYYQETEAMVNRLVNEKGIKRISVFYQDDSYGRAGLSGVRIAVQKRGIPILNEATYPRNTIQVKKGFETIHAANPEAVVMIGAYEPCAEFIRLMRDSGSEAIFLNVSFVGADALGDILENKGVGVVITQVVPFPYNTLIPVVPEFKQRLAKYFPQSEPGFVNMEGYLAAKALCAILQSTPEPMTRESFIAAAESSQQVDLGGFSFSFSPTDHQGSDTVFFTQIAPGGFVNPVKSLENLYQY